MRRPLVLTIVLSLAACAPLARAAAPVAAPGLPGAGATAAPARTVSRAPAIADGAALAVPAGLLDVLPTRPTGPHFSGAWLQASVIGRATASSGPAGAAVDGDGETEWNPRAFVAPGAPQWLALPLQAPAKQALAVAWHGHALHYVNFDYGRPRTYEVQISADSTDGAGGTWRTVARVDDNQVRSRVATFDAPGATWVRLKFLTAWSGSDREPYLREAAVYERTAAGMTDAWLILGDSTTSVGLDPARPPFLARAVAARHPGRLPITLSGGTGGEPAAHLAERLRVALPTLPPGSLVGLCYGTNDATFARKRRDFERDLQAAIATIKAAGHDPLLAVVPWSLNGAIADYAQACRDVAQANGLPPGPDFYAWFKAHPEELAFDRVHPNAQGVASMQRLWAEAGAFRYADASGE